MNDDNETCKRASVPNVYHGECFQNSQNSIFQNKIKKKENVSDDDNPSPVSKYVLISIIVKLY